MDRRTVGWGAGLFLLGLIAYLPSLRNGFIWDDDAYVTDNQALRSAEGLRRIWQPGAVHQTQFYPLSLTSLWIEYRLWGTSAPGYHFTNILLHAANAVLLWLILQQLKVPGAWLAAAIFVMHPLQVESAGWITERKNVLSGLFYFSAALTYLRFSDTRRWTTYAVSLALFVAALLSKTVTCSLPAALLLIAWWKQRPLLRELAWLAPFFAIGIVLGLFTAVVERRYIGAGGYEFDFSFIDRCLIAGRAIWFYLSKLLLPLKLAFIYPRWRIDSQAAWQYAFPLAAIGVATALWFGRRHLGVAPLVACLIFAGTLFPALGFFNIYPMKYSFVADHFQYHASAAMIALLTAIAERVVASQLRRAGAALLILVLGVLTWNQQSIYRNRETLWRDTVVKNPNGWVCHNNLGAVLFAQGKIDEAYDHYVTAVNLNPRDPSNHNNLGTALARLGRNDEAIAQFAEAIRLQPIFESAHYNLAMALAKEKRFDQAVAHYKEAIRTQPDFVAAHRNLGVALAMQAKFTEAIPHFENAVRLQPDDPEGYRNLALAYANVGRLDDAIACVRKAIELRPDDVRYRQTLDSLIQIQRKK